MTYDLTKVFLPVILGRMQKSGLGSLDLKFVLLCWGDTLNEQLPVVLDPPFAEAEQRQNFCLGILPAPTLQACGQPDGLGPEEKFSGGTTYDIWDDQCSPCPVAQSCVMSSH